MTSTQSWRLAGIVSVAVGLACASTAFALLNKVLSTADETAHVDYAYQVWHGHLPVFEHGLVFHPPANVPPVQWEAQHPPLFYALLAPIVGPLIGAGHWLTATLAGRGVCVLIAVACLVALAWAGSLVSTKHPARYAIAVPATVAPFSPFMRVGGSVYNDNLGALFTILALGIGIVAIRRGVSWRLLLAAAVVGAAGMLSRASFAVTLALMAVALAAGVLLHDPGERRARLVRAAALGATPIAVAAAASAWFYLRNKRLTGSYTGGHTQWAIDHLSRVPKPLSGVLTSTLFWGTDGQLLRQNGGVDAYLGPVLLGLVAALAGWSWLRRYTRHRPPVDRLQAGVVVLLGAQLVATLAGEAQYVTTGGGVITRYLLPALLPLGCVLAAGILALPGRAAGPVLLSYLAVAWGFFLHWAWTQPVVGGTHWSGRTLNHVPWSIVSATLAGLIVCGFVQAIALARVSAQPGGETPRHRSPVGRPVRAIQRLPAVPAPANARADSTNG